MSATSFATTQTEIVPSETQSFTVESSAQIVSSLLSTLTSSEDSTTQSIATSAISITSLFTPTTSIPESLTSSYTYFDTTECLLNSV
ncbi:hypothetical protein DPMN_074760 [Dreissena polymorpha]|nr:hypothetical protein DPMN_074760 [Dreissena polymorpha]